MRDRDELEAERGRLQADNDRLRTEAAANASANEKFRVLFEYSSDAHLIFDQYGIIDCNNAAIDMLRCTDKAQVLHLHPAALSPERQPDGRSSLEKSVEMDGLARKHGHHRFEWMHRRLDGEDFPVEVTLTPVVLSTGPALLVVWHELTELKRHEAELRAQLELIQHQRAEIQRLSMPVIEVWEGVLMVPVLGALDQEAAESLTTPVLAAIARTSARAIIIDLTGLTGADLPTARHLARLLAAIQLLGAEGLVVGIGPAVAQAFIAAGAEFSRVRTLATLREALRRCLRAE
ncbi:MAG: PAS domain S-box protein [Nannocystis sp.]|nr:STAS domain-containing protein [Nannocystis sp.]MBA3546496.1 PAS domain S-box protein [Nannocystis sp.]